MKYMGSKNRIAKYILPIMIKEARRKGIVTWIEPFVGGANMIDKVPSEFKRIGIDNNEYLIDFLKSIQSGWTPPVHISSDEYFEIKQNKDKDKTMTLWAGICCSYGGKWFGGYINDYKENRRLKNGRLPNHQIESRNGVLKQANLINGVVFLHDSYERCTKAQNCVIYCDPPYQGTTSYKTGTFDHNKFWEWCRYMSKDNLVFI